ncbi:DMT family transporter [Flavitalea flava]
MTFSALALVVAAALLHAIWNLTVKQVKGSLPFFWLVSITSAVLFLPFLIYQLRYEHISYGKVALGFGLGSAILHLFYFLALQIGYRKADLSVVYPVARGAGPLFSVIGAVLLFRERPGLWSIAGILMIISGVVIMTGFKIKKGTPVMKGIEYGLLTGIFIASYTLWDRAGVVDHQVSAVLISFASMIFPMLLLLPVSLRKKEEVKLEIKTHWKQIVVVAVFQPLSYLLVLAAMKTTPVTYVAPVRELSIVFGVFFGIQFLKEKDSLRRLIAALIILAGIVVLAMS